MLKAKTEGKPSDLACPERSRRGGYYQPDDKKTAATLRPSKTLNEILAML